MTVLNGGNTTHDRAMFSIKYESRNFGNRLHIISGDANMCEWAEYLKIGTTGLVLDLVEHNIYPKVIREYIIEDLHKISVNANPSHPLESIVRRLHHKNTNNPMTAIDIQREYLILAKRYLSGRDAMTDDLLKKWEYTLKMLQKNPAKLVGHVDWITKKALLEQYATQNKIEFNSVQNGTDNKLTFDTSNKNFYKLLNINLQYHDVRRDGLFYTLQRNIGFPRITTDVAIKRAVKEPPKDTRAFCRGKIASFYKNKLKSSLKRLDGCWSNIIIGDVYGDHNHFFYIPNPFLTYQQLIPRIKECVLRTSI